MTTTPIYITCAKCGEQKQLCNSVKIDGIKQPRLCKECLILSLNNGDDSVNNVYWVIQLFELKDTESIENLKKLISKNGKRN